MCLGLNVGVLWLMFRDICLGELEEFLVSRIKRLMIKGCRERS